MRPEEIERKASQGIGRVDQEEISGSFFIVGAPLGNRDDITYRASRALQSADLIVCTDERNAAMFLKSFNIKKRLMAVSEGIVEDAAEVIGSMVREGKRIVVLTDRGSVLTPPLAAVAAHVRELGLEPKVMPGVDAVSTTILMSGFAVDSYVVAGAIPARSEARAEFIAGIADRTDAIVIASTSPRPAPALAALAETFPDREAAIIVKATLPGETVLRDTVTQLARRFGDKRGTMEFVIVIGPAEQSVSENSHSEITDSE